MTTNKSWVCDLSPLIIHIIHCILFQVVVCLVIMFSIQWAYALGELSAALIIYVYIGQASPGYFPGQCLHSHKKS